MVWWFNDYVGDGCDDITLMSSNRAEDYNSIISSSSLVCPIIVEIQILTLFCPFAYNLSVSNSLALIRKLQQKPKGDIMKMHHKQMPPSPQIPQVD